MSYFYLAPRAALAHQDQEVEAVEAVKTEGVESQGRKTGKVVGSGLDLAQGGNHEEAEALLPPLAAAPGPGSEFQMGQLLHSLYI